MYHNALSAELRFYLDIPVAKLLLLRSKYYMVIYNGKLIFVVWDYLRVVRALTMVYKN